MRAFILTYAVCVLGVVISIVLPVLRKAIPPLTATPAGLSAFLPRIWEFAKPYLVIGLYSSFVAILLVAFLQDQLTDWRAALLAGYAADSTLQKMKKE